MVKRSSPVSRSIHARRKKNDDERTEERGVFWIGFGLGALALYVVMRLFSHL